jgi:histidine triad (HIT) family protein
VIGLEVPHAHIHLIPINSMNDCNFANPKLKLSKEEFEHIAKSIQQNFTY